MDDNELAPISLNALRATRQGLNYTDMIKDQLAKRALYAGIGTTGRDVPMQELLAYELRRDPRIALMLMGTSGSLNRGHVLNEVSDVTPTMLMGRLGIENGNARAGVSGTTVQMPDGSFKFMPGMADVGYSTPAFGGNVDISGEYGLMNTPTPFYGARIRYTKEY